MTIQNRYQRLLARRAPDDDRVLSKFAESFEAQPGTTTKYLLGALKPVEAKYTAKLVEQGNRVENQLSNRLSGAYSSIEFKRQGSVSNLTHIRYYSDVDVLVLIDKFFTLEPPLIPANPYQGVPEDDLLELRNRCVSNLSVAFPAVKIDDSGSTAVKMLKSGSLACAVDVVPANWYDTVAYANSQAERDRAIQVLDRDKRLRKKNSPFLFNHRLNEHDLAMRGVPRALVRLLKTVKADVEEEQSIQVDFSSFDICSLFYRFHRGTTARLDMPLDLLRGELEWMVAVAQNSSLREGVKVVDDSRDIFDTPSKAEAFGKLTSEVGKLWLEAMQEQQQRVLLTDSYRA